MKRLESNPFDAEILTLHFIGMCQEGISLKMGLPLKDVRASFDVIQVAYEGSGIVVNDRSSPRIRLRCTSGRDHNDEWSSCRYD